DMRWVTASAPLQRLSRLEGEASAGDWGALWSAERLEQRLSEAGVGGAESRAWIEAAARLCAGHARGGGDRLPWAHAFSAPPEPRLAAEEPLAAAANALTDIVRALAVRWP